MKTETELRLKLIMSNCKLLLANQYSSNTEAFDMLYEIISEAQDSIQELRTDR